MTTPEITMLSTLLGWIVLIQQIWLANKRANRAEKRAEHYKELAEQWQRNSNSLQESAISFKEGYETWRRIATGDSNFKASDELL